MGKPLEAETEGATSDEAVQRLRDLVENRLQDSVAIIEMKIQEGDRAIVKPLAALAREPARRPDL